MPSFLPSSSSISLALFQNLVFLRPPQKYGAPQDNLLSEQGFGLENPVIRGALTLCLPQAERFNSIVVKLDVDVDYGLSPGFVGGMISSVSTRSRKRWKALKREVRLGDHTGSFEDDDGNQDIEKSEGILLGRGIHVFEFSFNIFNSLTPKEESSYGTSQCWVTAVATPVGVSSKSSTTPVLQDRQKIELIMNPSLPSEQVLTAFDSTIQDFRQDLGVINLRHSSSHLTIAGPLHITFTLPHPNIPIQINSLECYIVQNTTLLEPPSVEAARLIDQGGGWKEKVWLTPEPEKHRLIEVEDGETGNEVTKIEKGKELVMKKWMRIPNGFILRPTTLSGSITPIQVSHSLITKITYSPLNSSGDPISYLSQKAIKTEKKNIVLASCCCLIDNLELPAYEAVTGKTTTMNDRADDDSLGRVIKPRPGTLPLPSMGESSISPFSITNGLGNAWRNTNDPTLPSTNPASSFSSSFLSRLFTKKHWDCICNQRLEALLPTKEEGEIWARDGLRRMASSTDRIDQHDNGEGNTRPKWLVNRTGG